MPRRNREEPMAMRTEALPSPQPLGPAVYDAAPETDTSLPILQIAINLVFGWQGAP
jgi:hypothetical protein